MKIYAFEVRKDEIEYFNSLSTLPGIELELHPEELTMDHIRNLENGSGVSILGMYHYRKPELDLMKSRTYIFSLPVPSDTITLTLNTRSRSESTCAMPIRSPRSGGLYNHDDSALSAQL